MKMQFAVTLILIIQILYSTAGFSSDHKEPQKKLNVLVILSQSIWYPWANLFISGLESDRRKNRFTFYYEHLDSTRFSAEESNRYWPDFLKEKYRSQPIDLVVLNGLSAIELMTKFGEDLFPDVPYVLTSSKVGNIRAFKHKAIIQNKSNVADTVRFALKLHKGIENIIHIGDSFYYAQECLTLLTETVKKINPKIHLQHHFPVDIKRTKAFVGKLPQNTIIFYSTVFKDLEGNRHIPKEFVSEISKVANAPLYVFLEPFIQDGVIGGITADPKLVGQAAMETGLKLLDIQKQGSEVVLSATVPPRPVFNWLAMKKWGISSGSLPKAAEIRFKEKTILEAYFWETVSALAVILVLSLLILLTAYLYFQRRRLTLSLQEVNQSLEDRVQQRTEELEQANRLRDRFFSLISHDLRGAIGSLSFFFNSVFTSTEKVEEKILKIMRETANNTKDLLEDILSWAGSQSGQIKPDKAEIDLLEVIEESIKLLRGQAVQKKINICLEANDPIIVFADYRMILTVFRNILHNAIKFSYREGKIDIQIEEKQGRVELTVKDYGIGMQPEQVENLFNMEKVSEKTLGTDSEMGFGFGLVLCHEFMTKNQGEIRVKSEREKGSSFIISIPGKILT